MTKIAKPPRLLTARVLEKAGACPEQVAQFRKHFGEGGFVTVEKALAVAGFFEWDWAAKHLLNSQALEAYNAAIAPAGEAYSIALAAAWKAYNTTIAAELEVYSIALAAAAEEAYSTALDPANAAYSIALAAAAEQAYSAALDPAYAAYSIALAAAEEAYSTAKAAAWANQFPGATATAADEAT